MYILIDVTEWSLVKYDWIETVEYYAYILMMISK